MKSTILTIVTLFAFTAFAPAAEPPTMHQVMFLTPESKRLDKLKELINRGGDVNVPLLYNRMLNVGEKESDRKPTAWGLDIAVEQGRTDMVTVLLANGAKIHGGELVKAARVSNHDDSFAMIAALLLAGADVNARHETFTALLRASSKGNTNSVKLLLAQPGIKVDESNLDGVTALMTAVDHGHVEIIDMLLKAGANVSMTNKHGDTAIAIAQKGFEQQQAQLKKQQAIISTLRSRAK